jgi:hypothetical protein
MGIETVYRQRRTSQPPQEYRSRRAKRADRLSAPQKAAHLTVAPQICRGGKLRYLYAISIFHDSIDTILKC